jgi:hypothetical protein
MRLTVSTFLEFLWNTAWETLILTFLVRLFGEIAFSVVSGVWHDMAPSLPPVLSPKASAHSPTFRFDFFHHHGFALLYSTLFIGKVAGELSRWSPYSWHRNKAAWVQSLFRKIWANWFRLLVANAFVAFGMTIALQIVQQFSLTQLIWQLALDLFHQLVSPIAGSTSGNFLVRTAESTASWYGENQFKFMFWGFYTAAICDDLGLPNLKTLGRFLWRRFVLRKDSKLSPSASPSPGAEQKSG